MQLYTFEYFPHLTDAPYLIGFQINDNNISDWTCIEKLGVLTKLTTVYLERNPVAEDPAYRRKLKMLIPSLTQIDATLCR